MRARKMMWVHFKFGFCLRFLLLARRWLDLSVAPSDQMDKPAVHHSCLPTTVVSTEIASLLHRVCGVCFFWRLITSPKRVTMSDAL